MTVGIAVINGCILFTIAFIIWQREKSPLKKLFWPALMVKLSAGIAVGLVYTYYYATGDTFYLFQEGQNLSLLAKSDGASYLKYLFASDATKEPRSLFFFKILSVINLLTNNNYWISSLYFSFASFVGAWWLVKKIVLVASDCRVVAIISFLFFPSVVFWSSGIIKESLAMGALFFLSSVFIMIWMRQRISISKWLLVLFAAWVLWNLKYYYMAVFFPVAAATLLTKHFLIPRLKIRYLSVEILLWFSVLIFPLGIIVFLHPNFYSGELLNVIASNYEYFAKVSDRDNVIHYSNLQPESTSMIMNAPWALFSGLFRPLFFEVSTFFQCVISIENFVVLIFTTVALWRARNAIYSPNRLLIIATIVYVVLLCIFLALSTPNFGTLVRYRVGFYPFFVFLILYKNPLTERLFLLVQKFRLVRKDS